MHELSLAGGVLKVVEDAAAREGFARVSQLRLEAGALCGVDVEALRFALETLRAGTCLQEAEIHIDTPPGRAWCMRCARAVPIFSRLDDCPDCGGHQLQPTDGTQLRVVELMVKDD